MMLVYIVKNMTTGEELRQYKYHRYSLAETTACKLARDSRREGNNHLFMAVERREGEQ